MKIQCPKCNTQISAEAINIQKMIAVCNLCNEIIDINQLSPHTTRPVESKIQEIATPNGEVSLLFPKSKSLGVFLIIFGGFWDLISGLIIAVMVFTGSIDMMGMLFVSLFFIIGFIIVLAGMAFAGMTTSLFISRNSIKSVRKTLGREFITLINNDKSVVVEKVIRYSQNEVPVYGIKISNAKNESITVGTNITDLEINWVKTLLIDRREGRR